MRYLSQLCIILGFTLAGEALQRLLPLPIPASVYGLVLLFLSLCAGIVKPEQIRQVSAFLISIMAVLFVSPAVGILDSWDLIQGQLLPICLLTLASTFLVFGISGRVTQRLLAKGGNADE